ncbi:hypothetical protein CI102_9233 [Trichoderma harzianum]|nr:hypothetical protein CI102_9233 [Trichoderma harzianum]
MAIDSEFYQYGPDLHRPRKERNTWNIPADQYNKSSIELEAVREIFGFTWEGLFRDNFNYILPFREIGNVTMPNPMKHPREPFELLDPTVPGHQRYVTL